MSLLIPLIPMLIFVSAFAVSLHRHRQAVEQLVVLPTQQRAELMNEFDSRWDLTHRNNLNIGNSRIGSHSIHSDRFFGPMEVNISDELFQFFDWQHFVKINKEYTSCLQTVIALTPRDLEIPQFFFRPKDFGRFVTREDNSMLRYHDIVETGTHIDLTYALESMQPYHARLLFKAKTAQFELFELIQSNDWTVEWTGEHLLVYSTGQVVEPDQLKFFASKVLTLANLLRNADHEADSSLDERLAASANRSR